VALILTLAREGVGVGRLMDLLAAPPIRRGELVPLLQDEIDSQYVPIHALMLQERHRLPKIRACIDYWAQWLGKVQASRPPSRKPRWAERPRVPDTSLFRSDKQVDGERYQIEPLTDRATVSQYVTRRRH
jgi:hypothetical protein